MASPTTDVLLHRETRIEREKNQAHRIRIKFMNSFFFVYVDHNMVLCYEFPMLFYQFVSTLHIAFLFAYLMCYVTFSTDSFLLLYIAEKSRSNKIVSNDYFSHLCYYPPPCFHLHNRFAVSSSSYSFLTEMKIINCATFSCQRQAINNFC
jgi:hypothetical protein